MIPPTSTAVLSATIAMVSFQIGATFAKQLIPVIGAPGTTAMRLGLSALLLVVLQRPWRSMPSRSAWPVVLAYGVSLGAMNSVFYLALSRIPLGIAVAIEFVGPLAVAVLASRGRLDYLWVGLAAIGLALLLPITDSGAGLDPVGILYALAAGVGWALYIVFGQKAGQAQGPTASTWGLIVAALLTVPVGVADAGTKLFDPSILPFGLGVAIFSSALPYTLEMIALRAMPARTFGILMSLEPAVAALAGLTFLSEVLTLTQWVAVALVIVASAGSTLTARRAADSAGPERREGWQSA